ncbi:MAG: metal ABC transporter ATP-binding protein [Actinomycetota bacterium]|nr:metal ABC transporter ATP-binding protein [Actinomycetota bacterium]
MGPALQVDAVSFAYPRQAVLECVTLRVDRGEFVALVGPNGSGKSTLLRIALGLTRPQGGEVRLFGVPPTDLAERWRVGYVPQRPVMSDVLPATVEEVVASGRLARRGWRRRLQGEDWEAVEAALGAVDLWPLRRRILSELSGGQQQRVLIAKALATGPEFLVLDEPVAGVDIESQRGFRDSLVALGREHGAAVLLVSHELSAVADDLDRVLVLRRGKIAFDGSPGELSATGVSLGVHPQDLPVWLER